MGPREKDEELRIKTQIEESMQRYLSMRDLRWTTSIVHRQRFLFRWVIGVELHSFVP